MSDEVVVREDYDDDLVDVDERQIPQGPGDPGYEPPLIVPELDLQGGTVFKVGEDEYESLSDAAEAIAPPTDDVPVDETDPEAPIDQGP